MLDVEGGDDVDAGVEHLDHILPALQMARAGNVAVREFIDQGELGTPREQRVEVELFEGLAAMVDQFAWQQFETSQ